MVSRLIAVDTFSAPLLSSAIHTLKYANAPDLAMPLGDMLASSVARAKVALENPLIVPIPLHPTRMHERGYNQAELLAQRLARASALPISNTAIIRARHTSTQTKQGSRWERLENMEGAFQARNQAVHNRDIILVDDVCTTGATLNAAARSLCDAGATSITGVVLARG